ncbi:MAG: hypothetical protein ACYDDI_01050 [Candidatus Acidiferrales bacterium]
MKENTEGTYSADTLAMAADLERLWMFRKKNFLLIEQYSPSAKPPQPARSGRCAWRDSSKEKKRKCEQVTLRKI